MQMTKAASRVVLVA